MKRRSLLSLIRATASFLAVAMAFGNLCPAKYTGAVEEMTVTDGGRPLRIDAPVEMPWGVSGEGIFGSNWAAQITGQDSDAAQTLNICPMGIWRYMSRATIIVFLILLVMSIWSTVITVERYMTFS